MREVMWKSMWVKWDYLFTYSRPEKHLSSMQCPLHKFLDSVFRIQNAITFRNWAELLLPTCPYDGNADAMQNINLIWNAKFSLKLMMKWEEMMFSMCWTFQPIIPYSSVKRIHWNKSYMHKIFMMLLNIPLCFMFTFLVNNHNIKARLSTFLWNKI